MSEYNNFGTRQLDLNNLTKEDKLEQIVQAYNEGYVFGRKQVGELYKVRSLRIDLKNFVQSSENRRILRKYEASPIPKELPLKTKAYSWKIHKTGSDFYKTKFGENIFTANKIKELCTTSHNFNLLIEFHIENQELADGYVICFHSPKHGVVHYAYPFHKLQHINTSFGIYMMTKTIEYYSKIGYNYIYLGSMNDKSAKYKLQFSPSSWYNETENKWSSDIDMLKENLI